MAPLFTFWTRIISVVDFLTGTTLSDHVSQGALQVPIQPYHQDTQTVAKYPTFDPPDELEPVPFRCEYPDYPAEDGWVSCNRNLERDCWLRNTKTGQRFDIHTDYENVGPRGIVRDYYLELTESTLDPDDSGNNVPVQLFNGSYPGPRLQACWGDQLRITIKNKLSTQGTTIHWHGLRQWKTGPMDGVNAVTQCPIAPEDEFTYVFNVSQYGTTWYHSHYSLQYAAGLLGPLTIYGPVAKNFDHQLAPIIMSDWLHEGVFDEWNRTTFEGGRIFIDNILQNGIGHWPPMSLGGVEDDLDAVGASPRFNEVLFQKGVKYLMRIINAAADTTFVFSIDNHKFWVVSTDFVSIEPYLADHVVVGIGQRYNIIVEANPTHFTTEQEFWMRTSPAPNCTSFKPGTPTPDERTGIVRYSLNDNLPTTKRNDFEPNCADETYYRNLTPIVPWEISPNRHMMDPFYLSFNSTVQGFPYYPCNKKNAHFQLVQDHPMWLNFSDPTLLNMEQDFGLKPWLAEVDTGSIPEENWVQLTIVSGPKHANDPLKPHPVPKKPGIYVPGRHPIHLHGHDFAVLDQCVPEDDKPCHPDNAALTLHNPPRRDVAFLPDNGYLIVAFRADNPGVWIMHCHIAFHASMGLATQIVENKQLVPSTFGFGWDEPFEAMCRNWNAWVAKHGWDPSDPCMTADPHLNALQDDSGI